jgi:hypothetical protein
VIRPPQAAGEEGDMAHEDEDSIRKRAFEIWEREGRFHGRDRDHWHQARREIDGEKAGNGAGDEGLTDGSLGAARLPRTPETSAAGLQPGGASPAGGRAADAASESHKRSR